MRPPNAIPVLTLLLCALHIAPCPADDDRHPRGKAPLELLLDHLRDTAGLAIAPDGTLYFTETKRGTLSRRATDGTLTVLMDRLDKPRGLARTKDGALFVLADAWRPATYHR